MPIVDLREHGPIGTVVLALHGQPGHGSDFTAVGRALPPDHLLLAPDRPGWGTRADDEAMGFAGNADEAVRELDEAGIDAAVVLGHSWGGGVALALALRHPDRVSGLVLASSVGPGAIDLTDRVLAMPAIGHAITSVGMRLLRLGLTLPTKLVTGKSVVDTSGWRTRSFVTEQHSLVEELPEILHRLDDITQPALVVAGHRDRVVPYSVAERLVHALRAAEIVAVPGNGHRLLESAPGVVADAAVRAGRLSRRRSDGGREASPWPTPR